MRANAAGEPVSVRGVLRDLLTDDNGEARGAVGIPSKTAHDEELPACGSPKFSDAREVACVSQTVRARQHMLPPTHGEAGSPFPPPATQDPTTAGSPGAQAKPVAPDASSLFRLICPLCRHTSR